jgi:hypothetical protein
VPTVLRFSGLRVLIYPRDHRPAHVHVVGGGRAAVLNLRCPSGPPELRENYGFGRADIARIAGTLAGSLSTLCLEWERIHERDG